MLHQAAPFVPVIDLFADAPTCNARAAAYLLAAYAVWFPAATVLLAVVDPGVGGPRAPLAVAADGRWYAGPDDGIFELVIRRAAAVQAWEITWRPERLSSSFHGRDLFAPVAARLARGEPPPGVPRDPVATCHPDWPDDLAEIVYVDHYGNAVTGLRTALLSKERASPHWGAPSAVPAPSLTSRLERHSGTRTQTASPKSPSTRAAPIESSASQSAAPSRSPPDLPQSALTSAQAPPGTLRFTNTALSPFRRRSAVRPWLRPGGQGIHSSVRSSSGCTR